VADRQGDQHDADLRPGTGARASPFPPVQGTKSAEVVS